MTDHLEPRLFARADDIRAIGEAMLACTLPKADWTHEAHLSTCAWLLLERPDIDIDDEIGGLIRRYNVSVGGVNDDHQGYHETITRVFVAGARDFLARSGGLDLLAADSATTRCASMRATGCSRSRPAAISFRRTLRRSLQSDCRVPTHSTSAPSARRFSAKRGCARRIGSALRIVERPGTAQATISSAMATRMM